MRCRRVEHRFIEAGVFLLDWLACVFTATKSGDRENSGYEHSELVPGQSVSSQTVCLLGGLLSNSHAHESLAWGPAVTVDPLIPCNKIVFPTHPRGQIPEACQFPSTPLTAMRPTHASSSRNHPICPGALFDCHGLAGSACLCVLHFHVCKSLNLESRFLM